MDGVLGARILGNLQYNENQHGWALELGQWAGIYIRNETLSTAGIDQSSESVRQKTTSRINSLLSRHDILLSATTVNFRDNDAGRFGTLLLDAVRDQKGATACALVVVGQCANTLRFIEGADLEVLVRGQLRSIDSRCPELGMATEALGTILLSHRGDYCSASGLSRLLVQLSRPLRVLVMSSDPRDAHRLRLAEERRELEHALAQSRFRGSLELHDVGSCRVQDIAFALDRYDPNILHFSGHGDNSALCFEDDKGEAIDVDKSALADLLGDQKSLKLVIMNACYSSDQAQAIADAVGYAIGIEGSMLDTDSVAFSRAFYTALGNGRTFEEAFERARKIMALTTKMKPHLLKRTT